MSRQEEREREWCEAVGAHIDRRNRELRFRPEGKEWGALVSEAVEAVGPRPSTDAAADALNAAADRIEAAHPRPAEGARYTREREIADAIAWLDAQRKPTTLTVGDPTAPAPYNAPDPGMSSRGIGCLHSAIISTAKALGWMPPAALLDALNMQCALAEKQEREFQAYLARVKAQEAAKAAAEEPKAGAA